MDDDHRHQYALNEAGQWVNAQNLPFMRGAVYFCDCPQKHPLKHVKPSGKEGKRYFSDYFAHINSAGSKRKNRDDSMSCCNGAGESMVHRLAKHKLRECINMLSFAVEECISCSWKKIYTFTDCSVNLEITSVDKLWRYDCIVHDNEGNKFFALEVVHTHFTSEKKAQSTKHCGLGIAEFLAEDVLKMSSANSRLRNLLCQKRHCDSCERILISAAQLGQFEQEINVWLNSEQVIFDALLKKSKYIQFEKDLMLMESPVVRAKAVIEQYQQSVWIESGRLWRVCLQGNINSSLSGFLINVNNDTRFPVSFMFLLILDRNWTSNKAERIRVELEKIWEQHSICNDLVYAVCCDTILSRTRYLHEGERSIFKCCLFPVFKRVEREHRLCANCGLYGHTSETCRRRFCTRCGRGGHSFNNCFATTTVNGRSIK